MGSRGDGPAGGGSGTVRDAKKASRKNEPNPIAEFIKGGGVTGAIIRGVTGGIKKIFRKMALHLNKLPPYKSVLIIGQTQTQTHEQR